MDDRIIAVYLRLSLEDSKTDSMSIENQRRLLEKYIFDSDLDDPVREFVDNGHTGTNFERPAVQELLGLVREGKVGCILVKDFSRLGRNALETGYLIERVFPLYRVRFISVSDNFDSAEHIGDTGGMEIAFKFLINEYYSRDLGKKISSAKQEKARRGEAVTKNCSFGYKLDNERKMVIDPEAAETVRMIYEMYANKKSASDIEKVLYAEKRPNPAAWKKHRNKNTCHEERRCIWHRGAIMSILHDEQYLGTYVAGKSRTIEVGNPNRKQVDKSEWIRIPDHHPAIISQELFDAAQANLRNKSAPVRKREISTAQRYNVNASALRGKVVCGHCGHKLRLSSTTTAAFDCWYTRCAPDIPCHKLRILKSELEEVVLTSIIRQAKMIMGCNDNYDSSARRHNADHTAELTRTSEELEDEKRLLYEQMISGEIPAAEYNERKAVVDMRLARHREVCETVLEHNAKNNPDEASVKAAREALTANTLSRELTDLLVDKVLIYPGNHLEICWKLAAFEIDFGTMEDCDYAG